MADVKNLQLIANSNRRRICAMVHAANVGHVGGSLSVIDVLTAIYEMDVDFGASRRSRVVLSKGHATPALYAELTEKGIIDEADYPTFRQIDSKLQGHPHTEAIPEVDATTGLLGQGFSIAVGMALAKRANGDQTRVYAICGDGEAQEGQIWEALMLAAQEKLDRLILVFDCNGLGSHNPIDETISIEPLADKLRAFNLNVLEIDGHDMARIMDALGRAWKHTGSATAIIARTTKGKGVSFMENDGAWHSRGLSDAEYETAIRELDAERVRLI